VTLDPELLEILACPLDHGPLWYLPEERCLYNPRLRRRYRIEGDIPVMLVEESELVDDEEHARLCARYEGAGGKDGDEG
jgi:uncharacterized protein YbaR (Trm112 family)